MSDIDINLDELLEKAGNKFLLSNAAAGRAKQIIEGSLPYVNHFDPNNPLVTALREIADDKIKIKILAGPTNKPKDSGKKDKETERPSILESLAKGAKKKVEKIEKGEKKK
ncbi:DNA-directed RNA polymerase subunit omega [candidate division WOR-1 bacterium RIFOXYB2_FULL_42_35]|uniref:DNA-directed RNA polymerase subunit omega n=1 Tax=candidate division WOR-1 bacterium RIFOXYC2_FULL_41_25 TaxID=1802586 RepID=A0A1F4TK72_UNCSA|nr:MAG: DNA-directed RNA polymerase subunit omega [candidate division WOR-1 bacterium RIFOXYA2_FULL_41_14]OGC23474.1 MAG: DNA-directed RNA polymerase subunit omega [candidate division WOR-1 bacterium RIFOXYB2_FULL_42_35]OGC32997.1 MAG: DNA-directed RNA polymerase subunit omega [candidate division WOR-1 bacterium RIFOXYC2_FULL_41_25]OGC44117.1 MAG: DNA-directed RNA polymerase subunit omega [candidate division WOR-1 bacterium RIFOXYD2_FULL_41_8]